MLSLSEVHKAMRTIDTAIDQIGEARAELGATHSRLEQQQSMLQRKVHVYTNTTMSLISVDYAQAMSTQTAAQISLMSAAQLMHVAKVNALRVIDLINQPALAVR